MEYPELNALTEVTKAQTSAIVAQKVVLEGIKSFLERQKETMERYEEKVVEVNKKVETVEDKVVKSVEEGNKKILEKLLDLEYTSKVHWFIVGGGFLGVIVSVVGAIAVILTK